jgi:hypothetical protein
MTNHDSHHFMQNFIGNQTSRIPNKNNMWAPVRPDTTLRNGEDRLSDIYLAKEISEKRIERLISNKIPSFEKRISLKK